MKRTIINITILAASMVLAASCSDFLKENPTFVAPENYYQTEDECVNAVNGTYNTNRLTDYAAIGSRPIIQMLAFQTGLTDMTNTRPTAITNILNGNIRAEEDFVASIWNNAYTYIERCNSAIYNLEERSDIPLSEAKKNTLLAEVYTNRADNYFFLVRQYGPVPLKITRTTGIDDAQLPLNTESEVLHQIAADLEKAEKLKENDAWNEPSGRISKGLIKARLADVYLTIAGYPLCETDYYKKAYDKALEVVNSGAFSLYDTYAEAHSSYDINGGEYLFSKQCLIDVVNNQLHMSGIPHGLEGTITIADATMRGGYWMPHADFYASYAEGDKRTEDRAYYYTSAPALDGSGDVTFDQPHIYKYWDDECAVKGKSSTNMPLDRYTSVLLTLAEAACAGGSTSDAAAIDAYYQVRHRAMPTEAKPATLTFDMVFKERMWEQCFEGVNWFTMLRTRKAFDPGNNKVVDMIGYKAPERSYPFDQDDLLLPYPVDQVRLNPNLVRK